MSFWLSRGYTKCASSTLNGECTLRQDDRLSICYLIPNFNNENQLISRAFHLSSIYWVEMTTPNH